MVEQLKFEDFFPYKQEPIDIAVLKANWREISDKHGIEFFKDFDDLDEFMYAIIRSESGDLGYLQAYQNSQEFEPKKVTIRLQANNKAPVSSLQNILNSLGLGLEDVDWLNPAFNGGTAWQMKRQDDNGNVFVMFNALTEDHARALVEDFNTRGHKQHYWYEKVTFPSL